MTSDHKDAPKLWHGTSVRTLVIFSFAWLGAPLLVIAFINLLFHMGAILYLIMVPWVLFGMIFVLRPNWGDRFARAIEEQEKRDSERFSKWKPPGFP
jgi:hypothetical protein